MSNDASLQKKGAKIELAQCPPNLCTFVALRIVFLSTHTVMKKSIMSCSNFKLDAVN